MNKCKIIEASNTVLNVYELSQTLGKPCKIDSDGILAILEDNYKDESKEFYDKVTRVILDTI